MHAELLSFVEEAVAADVPHDQKLKNLDDLATDVQGDESLSQAERNDLERRLGQYRAELRTAAKEA